MTPEEKAKRYDEAIKKLRSLHDDYDTVSTLIDIKEELENIFPELKEPVGEKIRKSLAAYFAKFKQSDMGDADFSFGDIVAWFEKQEWSEEDEEEFQTAIETLVEAGQHDSANWLKSLKDRYTWKPSNR